MTKKQTVKKDSTKKNPVVFPPPEPEHYAIRTMKSKEYGWYCAACFFFPWSLLYSGVKHIILEIRKNFNKASNSFASPKQAVVAPTIENTTKKEERRLPRPTIKNLRGDPYTDGGTHSLLLGKDISTRCEGGNPDVIVAWSKESGRMLVATMVGDTDILWSESDISLSDWE